MRKIYLAGAIGCYYREEDRVSHPSAWRNRATVLLDGFECFDPTMYYKYDADLHKTEKEVMNFDLNNLRSSDLVLVNLKDITKSEGTIQELMFAWLNHIPIIGFCDSKDGEMPEDIRTLHPWIVEEIDRIEYGDKALEFALDYICTFYL